MENDTFEPYFELKNAAGIAQYVIFWLAVYSNDPQKKSIVYDKLKIIFSGDSVYQIKVLDGYVFGAVFIQRLGRKRLRNLKYHLENIDKNRYGPIDWAYYLKGK